MCTKLIRAVCAFGVLTMFGVGCAGTMKIPPKPPYGHCKTTIDREKQMVIQRCNVAETTSDPAIPVRVP